MTILDKLQQKITKESLARALPKRTMRLAKSKTYVPTAAYQLFVAFFLAVIIGWIGIYFPQTPASKEVAETKAAPTLTLKEYVEKQRAEYPGPETQSHQAEAQIVIVEKDEEAQAFDAARAGGLPEAIALYKSFLGKNPGTPQQLFRLATLLQRNGQAQEAATFYEKTLKNDPGHMDALSNLMYLLKDVAPDQALRTLKKYAQAAPASSQNYGHISYLFGQIAEFDTALKYAIQAEKLDQSDPTLLFNLAVLYERVGAKTQAKSAYTRLLNHHKDADLPWAAIRDKV